MSSSSVVSSRIINFFLIYLFLFYTFRLFSFCIARCRIYIHFSLILHSIFTTFYCVDRRFFFFKLCRLFIIFLSMDFIRFINIIWILFYDLMRVLHSLHPLSPFTVYLFVRLFLDCHVPFCSTALIFLYLLSVSSTILFSTSFLNLFHSLYLVFIVCY